MQGNFAAVKGGIPFGPAYNYLPRVTANPASLPTNKDPDYLPDPPSTRGTTGKVGGGVSCATTLLQRVMFLLARTTR